MKSLAGLPRLDSFHSCFNSLTSHHRVLYADGPSGLAWQSFRAHVR